MNKPAASAESRSLISPQADFWLVGGASLVFMTAIYIAVVSYGLEIRDSFAMIFLYAAFAVNYPHFAFSYQLFYADFPSYLRSKDATFGSKLRLITAGILAPVLLLCWFVYIGVARDMVMLGYVANTFWFFVGWHYVKQGYGVLITLSVYKRVFYGPWQKRILLLNAYLVWIAVWVNTNSAGNGDSFYDIPFTTLAFPAQVVSITAYLAMASSVAALLALMHVSLVQKKGLALNAVVGYITAIYIWWPLLQTKMLFLLCVPFFHSLQYFPFVFRLERGKIKNRAQPGEQYSIGKSLVKFALSGVILGAVFMDLLPRLMDHLYNDWPENFSRQFFLVCFLLFINIHHYFIDNAFWRKDNATVQKLLFSA